MQLLGVASGMCIKRGSMEEHCNQCGLLTENVFWAVLGSAQWDSTESAFSCCCCCLLCEFFSVYFFSWCIL